MPQVRHSNNPQTLCRLLQTTPGSPQKKCAAVPRDTRHSTRNVRRSIIPRQHRGKPPPTRHKIPRNRQIPSSPVAQKEGFGDPKPSFTADGHEPAPINPESPIRGTRAEYLRRPPSRPHRPHWDPWRASAGSSSGRSGYPYPATRARRPEQPKRPHCRSAG